MQRVMSGVGIHLDSSLPLVRRQGMIVAEALTAKLNIPVEKLKFEVFLKFFIFLLLPQWDSII